MSSKGGERRVGRGGRGLNRMPTKIPREEEDKMIRRGRGLVTVHGTYLLYLRVVLT